MSITPFVLATRAIAAEFIGRESRTIFLFGAAVLVVFHLIGWWLIGQNGWWWLLETVFITISLIFIALSAVVMTIMRIFRPSQTQKQRQMVRSFVDSLQEVTETTLTPKFILVYRVVKDAVVSKNTRFIEQAISKTSSLRPGFRDIVNSFDEKN